MGAGETGGQQADQESKENQEPRELLAEIAGLCRNEKRTEGKHPGWGGLGSWVGEKG